MVYRSFFSLVGAAVFSILFFGSMPNAKAARLYTNTNPLFEACVQRCEEQTPLGALTKRGCYKGCAEIRRTANIPESYRSMASCIEDMNELELVKDLVIEKHQARCDRQTSHIHKRKGCRDAVEVYMRAATVNSICYNQQPKAIAKQTPRTSLTTRYPAVTTHTSSRPVHTGQPAYSYGTPQGNALSMPPVFDTPKYSPTPEKASKKSAQAVKRPTPVTPSAKAPSSKTAGKAPSLAPPKQATPPKTTQNSKAVPVITPSTATMGTATTSALKDLAETPATAPSVPPIAPVSPVPAPLAPVTTKATPATNVPPISSASEPAISTTQESTPSPHQPSAPAPAPEPVINAATAPTAPPVIAPPTAIMPDFTAVPQTRPAPNASEVQPPRHPQNTGQAPDLLPRLQPTSPQTTRQAGGATTGGIDSPMPQPIPAPAI